MAAPSKVLLRPVLFDWSVMMMMILWAWLQLAVLSDKSRVPSSPTGGAAKAAPRPSTGSSEDVSKTRKAKTPGLKAPSTAKSECWEHSGGC